MHGYCCNVSLLIFCKYKPIGVNVRTFAVQVLFMPLRLIKQSIQMLVVPIRGTQFKCVYVCVCDGSLAICAVMQFIELEAHHSI